MKLLRYYTSHLALLFITLVEGMHLQVQEYLTLHLIVFIDYRYQSLLYLLSVHLFDTLDIQQRTLLCFNCYRNNISFISHRMFGLSSTISFSYSHREITSLVFDLTFSRSLTSIVFYIPLVL